MKEKRKLVGRRFEDFINHGILLDLTPAEKIWHNFLTDFRYRLILDRRVRIRREEDELPDKADEVFKPQTTGFYYKDIFKDNTNRKK